MIVDDSECAISKFFDVPYRVCQVMQSTPISPVFEQKHRIRL